MKQAWFGFLCIPLLAGQTLPAPSLRGPVMGWVFDAGAGAVRPVWGVPGASLLGDALPSPALSGAAVSPRQDYALVTDAEGATGVIRLPEGTLAPLTGAIGSPSRVALSPRGEAAALFRAEGNALQVATNLPGAASMAMRPYPAGAPAPAALAVSDDGEAVLAAYDETLVLLDKEGGRPLAVPGAVVALSFRAGTHDALAATAGGEVWLIAAADANARYRRLAGPQEGVSAPLAVEFSRDGARAFIAGAGGATAVDLATGAATAIACRCTPTGLVRLDGDSLFLLTALKPTILMDGSGAAPRTWLVPPSATEEDR